MDDAIFVDSINGIQEIIRQADLKSEEDIGFLNDISDDIVDIYTTLPAEDIGATLSEEDQKKFTESTSHLVFLLLALKSIESSTEDSIKELPVLKYLAKNVLERVSGTPLFKKYVANIKLTGGVKFPSIGSIAGIAGTISFAALVATSTYLVGKGEANYDDFAPTVPTISIPGLPGLANWLNGASTVPDFMIDLQNHSPANNEEVQLFNKLNDQTLATAAELGAVEGTYLNLQQSFSNSANKLEKLANNAAATPLQQHIGKWISNERKEEKELAELTTKLESLTKNISKKEKQKKETESSWAITGKQSALAAADAELTTDRAEAKQVQEKIDMLSGQIIGQIDLQAFSDRLMFNPPENVTIRTAELLPGVSPSTGSSEFVIDISGQDGWFKALKPTVTTTDYAVAAVTVAVSEIGVAKAVGGEGNIQDSLNGIQSKMQTIFPKDPLVAEFFTSLAQHNTTVALRENIKDRIEVLSRQKEGQQYLKVHLNNKEIRGNADEKFEEWKRTSGETDPKKIKVVDDRLAIEVNRAITLSGQLNVVLDPKIAANYIFSCALNPGDCKTVNFREARSRIILLQKPLYLYFQAAKTGLGISLALLFIIGVGSTLSNLFGNIGKISLFSKTYNIQGNLIEGTGQGQLGDAPPRVPGQGQLGDVAVPAAVPAQGQLRDVDAPDRVPEELIPGVPAPVAVAAPALAPVAAAVPQGAAPQGRARAIEAALYGPQPGPGGRRRKTNKRRRPTTYRRHNRKTKRRSTYRQR